MKQLLLKNRGFIAFLLAFGLFRTAVADWNPIPSSSMRPTLLEGDVVLVNRLAFDLKLPLSDIIVAHIGEPQRGDVVTFSSPKDGTRLIKRLIALPGDTVEMHDKVLNINGVVASYSPTGAVPDLYGEVRIPAQQLVEGGVLGDHAMQWLALASSKDDFGPLVVPERQYLMLGDNRDNSADSRYFGLVPRHLLIGRAHRILVSADISDRWQPRFERFGMRVR